MLAVTTDGLIFIERGWLSSNNVLLHDEKSAILVDTGYWTHGAQTVELVKNALGQRKLSLILNTHLHSDHCGGNALLQQTFQVAETKIPPGHAAHVFDWDPAALTYTPTGQHCPPFAATGVVMPGDVFEIGEQTWRAYAAPGHDPNSLIFYNAQTQTLISADALWENGFGVVFPEIEGIHAFEEVADTLDLIESLAPCRILPGHGGAFNDVSAALARARTRLHMFQHDPIKHASYAAKVLLKFKLLELQQIRFEEFKTWGLGCGYLEELRHRYFEKQDFAAWLRSLITDLARSGAATVQGEYIYNA